MKTFSTNKEALTTIQRILDTNSSSDPGVVLIDMLNPNRLMNCIKKTYLKNKDNAKLIPMAKKIYEEIKDQLTYRLVVIVYEKKDFDTEDLVNINGITLSMSMCKALQDYCLIFENDRFMLRNSNDVVGNV